MASSLYLFKPLKELTPQEKKKLLQRNQQELLHILEEVVLPLAQKIEKKPFLSLKEAVEKYDGFLPSKWVLEKKDLEKAYSLSEKEFPSLLKSFSLAKKNVENFYKKWLPKEFRLKRRNQEIGVRIAPVEKVAVYIPGGKALYPSTILMGVIPAKLAGVKEIYLLSPPQKERKEVPYLLQAVSYLVGVEKVFQIGGAQGILSVGYSIPQIPIPKVDMVVGPGNLYVAAAKLFLFLQGLCGIDSIAGPSEILILTEKGKDPFYIAYDLLAQLEHEESTFGLILTSSKEHADAILKEIEKILPRLPRKEIIKKALKKYGGILWDKDVEKLIEFTNEIAPEHLEIIHKEEKEILKKIHSAGSIFLGEYTPVVVGDYIGGTNHILPTGGSARFLQGLNPLHFLKWIPYQKISQEKLSSFLPHIRNMALFEKLETHYFSAEARFHAKG